MPERVALATCRRLQAGAEDAEVIMSAAAGRGITVDLVEWDRKDVDWSRYHSVLLHAPWDYSDRVDEFVSWLDANSGTTSFLNPLDLIKWNIDKRYLLELSDRGVDIPKTLSLPSGTELTQEQVWEVFGDAPTVVKPTVGAGGRGAYLCSTPLEAQQVGEKLGERPVLVQQYEPAIESEGELSAVFLHGRLSHVVRKMPQEGQFKVQENYGGTASPEERADWIDRYGSRVLGLLPAPPAYARVDLVARGGSRPVLMELELIEPDLFLRLAPEAAVQTYLDLALA